MRSISVQRFTAAGQKCGVCGDAINGAKDNELPNGHFAKRLTVTRVYKQGQVIKVKVRLTAAHKGYFVFKLCPAKGRRREVTQQCLDKHVLKVIGHADKR